MRTLRYLALLLVAVAAFAQEQSSKPQSTSTLQTQAEYNVLVRGADGNLTLRPLPDKPRTFTLFTARGPMQLRGSAPRVLQRSEIDTSTCYYIRSYAVKRVDGTDQTEPAGMTTCTPASRFQLRRSAPRK